MVQYTGVNVEEAIQNGLKELDIPWYPITRPGSLVSNSN